MMELNVKAMGATAALLWGLVVGLMTLGNLTWGYGQAFLDVVASIYPGFTADGSMKALIVGVTYALLDGAIGGMVFAWLYNRCVRAITTPV